jgi:hypothetical protein
MKYTRWLTQFKNKHLYQQNTAKWQLYVPAINVRVEISMHSALVELQVGKRK